MKKHIRPAAIRAKIAKHVGWHGGIHFRTDQDGATLGRAVGTAVYKNNLRPLHDGD